MPLDQDTIARRLRAARILRGIDDQRQLADVPALNENDLGWTTIQRIESGKRAARPMELLVIADALNVPRWWFTAETWPPPADSDPLELLREMRGVADLLARAAGRANGSSPGQRVIDAARRLGFNPPPDADEDGLWERLAEFVDAQRPSAPRAPRSPRKRPAGDEGDQASSG